MSDVTFSREAATAAVYFGSMLATEVAFSYATTTFAEREAHEFDLLGYWDNMHTDYVRVLAEKLCSRTGGLELPESVALFHLACDACEGALNSGGGGEMVRLVEQLDRVLEMVMPA